MRHVLMLALLAAGTFAVPQECVRPKPIYKVIKLSLTEVGISCNNGGDPAGRKIGDVLVISCGK